MPFQKIGHDTKLNVYEDGSGGHAIGIVMSDSPQLDAFGRQRVSDPTGLFASKLSYDNNPLWWYEKITNTSGNAAVTHDSNASTAVITCEAEDTIIRQSKTYHNYQPGKSQLIMMTFVMGTATTGVTRRVGYYETNDGIFLEQTVAGAGIVMRTSTSGTPVDTRVEQSDWNIETLPALDLSKAQILFIDMEWLGTGRVRVGFVIGGEIIYVHEFLNANLQSNVYIKTPNLPVRYELICAAGVIGSHTLRQICSTVISEGGVELNWGHPFSVSNRNALRTVSTTNLPILSIRPKQTFNGLANRSQIVLDSIAAFSEDAPVFLDFICGGSINNASWQSANEYSAVEYDVAASTISGGIVFQSEYVATGVGAATGNLSRSQSLGLPIALDIDGNHPSTSPTDVISIVGIRIGTTNTDVSAAIAWQEIR